MNATVTLHIAPFRDKGWRYWLVERLLPHLFDYRPVIVGVGPNAITYQIHDELDLAARTVELEDGRILGDWEPAIANAGGFRL